MVTDYAHAKICHFQTVVCLLRPLISELHSRSRHRSLKEKVERFVRSAHKTLKTRLKYIS